MTTVGKKELAAALGWSRPTLDRRLKTDRKFPVVSRGDQSGGWAFDPAQVKAYLAGGTVKPPAIDKAQLRDAVAPPLPEKPQRRRSAHHEGEATARQRKDAAQADLLEDKRGRERGELVRADDVRRVLTLLCTRLGKNLDGLVDQVVKLLALPDSATSPLRSLVDDVRTAMVKDAEPLLVTPDGG